MCRTYSSVLNYVFCLALLRSDVQECSTSYYLVTENLSFDSAEQYCLNTYGARLAVVNSADEQEFLAGVIQVSEGEVNTLTLCTGMH